MRKPNIYLSEYQRDHLLHRMTDESDVITNLRDKMITKKEYDEIINLQKKLNKIKY